MSDESDDADDTNTFVIHHFHGVHKVSGFNLHSVDDYKTIILII